ncbi:DoxX family protein [Myxococcus landrumensis]|uniref:DoxX family protein n=1 Tax=Myxococcus landrumensis TaxID=2813577 RepID=A0ABX7N6H1_9BACT|nr:DoxX family protein [Myxococcus landrumus]QSQ14238.1 DoxX family protein [Myxococcus landrumus]
MEGRTALGWALVRGVFGLSLALGHGLMKVTLDISNFAEGLGNAGLPIPLFLAWCSSLSEMVGGVLIAVGLFTRPAAGFATFNLLVALSFQRGYSFAAMELTVLYFTVMLAVLLMGAGSWSLDARLRRKA